MNSIKTAALRASVESFAKSPALSVDEGAGLIRGAALMKIGEARGWGFLIDAMTLKQVAGLINSADGGVKMRFKHPDMAADDLGDVIGKVKNARIVGDTLRGDVALGDYATVLPGLGDVRSYLLKRAMSDPSGLGLS